MQFPVIPVAVAAGTSAVGVIGNKVIAPLCQPWVRRPASSG